MELNIKQTDRSHTHLPPGGALWHAINACRICGSTAMHVVFDLGMHALSGRFPAKDEPDVPTAPLQVVLCEQCGLLQLAHNVERDEMYRQGYGYRSGINESMKDHLQRLAKDAVARVEIRRGDMILDIGCNDGTMLSAFPVSAGVRRVGIDPTADQFRDLYPPEIETVADYFSAKSFAGIGAKGDAKIVCSISMFYDLPDPNAFVAALADALAPGGIWVLEQAYTPRTLENNAFDTICHEHLEYYAMAQIETLLARHGLRIWDVSFNEVNGGSFRLFVCHRDAPYREAPAVAETRAREATLGLTGKAPYEAFWQRVLGIRRDVICFLEREVNAGRTVLGYGASTKGNTMLQFCGITKALLPAVADRNSEKWGRRLPATNIPIISEEEARARKPDFLLALPWHFRDSFLTREAEYRRNGGRFIFAMPNFEVV